MTQPLSFSPAETDIGVDTPGPQSPTLPAHRPRVVLLGPALRAVSGVSTHLKHLLQSDLGTSIELLHFQVGSEGRGDESPVRKFWRLVSSPVAFWRFCLRHRPEVVHLNTSLEPKSYWRDIAYLLVGKLLGCKVIYQVNGGALPLDFFRGSRVPTEILRRVLLSSDAVVLLANVEQQAYRSFVPQAQLHVIANATDVEDLAGEPIDAKPVDPLHIVYVGRLATNKGIFDIVNAVGLLRTEGRAVRLTVAGSGPDEDAMRRLVASSDLSDRISFAGPLFGEQKNALWRSAHVFAFPTYHREGLPYALLEAMAAGAVPITTAVGAIPDVLHDGIHGVLIEPRQPSALALAIRRLDEDRVELFGMARAGRQRVLSAYTVERLAADFRGLYLSLVNED